ncbi:MAG: DUF6164 family protein [Pseudohongiellaceae bacterium]|nr:DUF6164 family protein [Pseudohongiellaceae bacterium]
MAKLIFKLRNVPADEVDEVLLLLEQNNIDFYETKAGNWGISMPALWVQDDSEYDKARELISQYQAERAQRMRAEYEELLEQGKAQTLLDSFVQQPIKFIAYTSLAALVVYLSTSTFFF